MSKNFIKKTLRNLRRGLNFSGLDERNAPDEPFALFEQWMAAAIKHEPFEPNAMTLATASLDGKPSARVVLLKDFSPEGFVFYTNYESRKGVDLSKNPQASVVFYWGSLSRQVLIDGRVTKRSREDARQYFHSRPRGSQVAAYASQQSREVASRDALEKSIQAVNEEFKGKDIPCPECWGGFSLIPERIEFWQGRLDRTHDRLVYTKGASGAWQRVRLAP